MTNPEPRPMMREPAVRAITGDETRKALDSRIARGQFPAPVKIGPRSVAWFCDEVVAWQAQRAAERDAAQNAKREARERADRERADRAARRAERDCITSDKNT